MRTSWILAASAAAALALTGCGSSSTSGSAASGGAGSTSSSSPAATTDLASWESSLGPIVVDGEGRTLYMFDKDSAGAASACTGPCVSLWPALTTTSSHPTVTGVTGDVGTAPTADGRQQVTLDGHRLYAFSGDPGARQINGQGFMGLWWAVAPDGTKVTGAAASSWSSAPAQQPTY